MDKENIKLNNENTEEVDVKAYSEMDLKRANIITQTFVEKVEQIAPVRIASTQDEKSGALKIRELFHKTLGLPSRMEPFTVRPLAGRYGVPILGVVYGIALANYIVGVLVSHKISYMFLAFAIVLTLAACVLFTVQVLMNKNTFNFIYPKRTSYNVFSEIAARAACEYTLVIGGHYDSAMDRSDFFMFLKDKNLPKWLSTLIKGLSLLSVPTLFILAAVTISLPARGANAKAFLFLFPTIFSGLAIFYLVTYFSYTKRSSSIGREGLNGAGLSLAVVDYLRLHPELVPENCKIILANFGSKECGAKGAEQMILQHYGSDGLLVNPVFINIARVGDNPNNVVQGDKQYRLSYDLKVTNLAFNTLKDSGLNPDFAFNKSMVTDSTPFAKHKLPAVTLDLRLMDNVSESFNDAFIGATNVAVDVLKYMEERQQLYKGTIAEDISTIK